MITPAKTNTIGVSLICDLDDEVSGEVFGYNDEGDFVLSSDEFANLAIPSLNQQEGTFVSIDKKVVPTNVAISFEGYNLNDLANAVGLREKYTIDYTKKLPIDKGFKAIDFDNLENHYEIDWKRETSNGGRETRVEVEEVDDIDSYDGTIIYLTNPVLEFNQWTNRAFNSELKLVGSNQFAIGAKIKDGDRVVVEFGGQVVDITFEVDKKQKGVIAKMPIANLEFGGSFLENSY